MMNPVPAWKATMRQTQKKKVEEPKTLIESIFNDEVKRKMTTKERRILLAKPKKIRKPK
jgi:hypothetical protein